jgi:HSP20 family molecular chaperone IbpA
VRKDTRNLGQILSGLGDLLEGLSGLAEEGAEVLDTVGRGRASVTYGWSIGNASSRGTRPEGPATNALPRPARGGAAVVHEVFDEGEFVRTVIDVPGVVDGDIRFNVRGQEVTVEARRHNGRRIIRIKVPVTVSAEGATSSYRNGIFEILLPKYRGAASEFEREAYDGSR